MTPELTLAAPDSILGLLQRGRGEGYVRATGAPARDVAGALFECLRHDPRCDQQLDSRSGYYASIISTIEMPLFPVRDAMRAVAETQVERLECYLPVDVLGVLVARGSREALDLLINEVREGPAWLEAATVLEHRSKRATWEPLGRDLFARLADEDVALIAYGAYGYHTGEPWSTWAEAVPRLRDAVVAANSGMVDEAPERMEPKPQLDTRLSTEDLLARVDGRTITKTIRILEHRRRPEDVPLLRHHVTEAPGLGRAAALLALRALGDTALLDEAVAVVETASTGRERMAAIGYLAGLPPERTRPRVEEWLSQSWPLNLIGRSILEEHAQPHDVPLLIAELRQGLAEEDHYRCCFAVEALTPLASSDAHGSIREYYESTAYSYGRPRAARALQRLEPDFANATGVECLFDSEPEGRLLGVEAASMEMDGVPARLAALLRDPVERDDVRELSAKMLGT